MQNHNISHTSKKIFHPLTVTISLVIILLLGYSSLPTRAQPAATGTGAPQGAAVPQGASTEVATNVCQIELRQYFDTAMRDYRNFLETTFQNKSSTSSLLDTAFAHYKEFRTAAMNKYAQYLPQQGAGQLSEGLQPGACLAIVEENLAEARRLLESRARTSSSVKKTTALISKYQEINNQLRTLNQSFITMKAYLDTFAAKLPCYIKKSCNKA